MWILLNRLRERSLMGIVVLVTSCAPMMALGAPDRTAIRAPAAETLAQFPAVTGFQISPDGRHLLAIGSEGDIRSILVWKMSDLSAKPTVIGARNMQIRSASFLKNDVLQVSMTQPFDLRTDEITKTFISKLLFTDLEGKEWFEPMAATDLARSEESRVQAALGNPTVLSRMPSDPDHIVLESDSRGESRSIYRYNLRTRSATRIMRLGEADNTVWVNAVGVPWAKSRGGSDGEGAFIAIDFRGKSGEWEEHFRSYVKNRDVVNVIAPGFKPDTAVIVSNVGREFAGLYEYDILNRKILSPLFEHKYFDATGVRSFRADLGSAPEGFEGYSFDGHLGREDYWADPKIESVVRGVAAALGIREISQELLSATGAERAVVKAYDGVNLRLLQIVQGKNPAYIFKISGLNHPPEYYLLRGDAFQLLGKEYPQIDKRSLGVSRYVYYRARDGLNIPAYLTMPNPQKCGAGPYSAVIHPHGGPWARDTMDYDGSGWVPLMVSQCRVVLQPQFRGSAGWGRTLWYAGDREWGQKMQDDKDDGAKWLIDQKLADPNRLAMFGFSYGGYAAFVAAVRPNGLYKCAIAGAGVSDIERIWSRFFTNPFFRQRQEPTVRGLSPLREAHQTQIPIMVFHGDRDQTVPLIQSELFVDRARSAGRTVEYHPLKDYAHGQAWTRDTMSKQLQLISNYLNVGCGESGL